MHEKVSPRGGCYPRRAGSREQACGEERHECICRESPGDILGYSHREKSRDGCHRAVFMGFVIMYMLGNLKISAARRISTPMPGSCGKSGAWRWAMDSCSAKLLRNVRYWWMT
jgi:hypothetical protein